MIQSQAANCKLPNRYVARFTIVHSKTEINFPLLSSILLLLLLKLILLLLSLLLLLLLLIFFYLCCLTLSGMNSILVYVGSEILGNYFPFSWQVRGNIQHAELLAMNLVGTTVWIIISFYLYYIKFFVKI